MTAFSIQADLQDQIQSIPSAESLERHLLNYDFPAGFAERLAAEERWSLAFSLGVLREYRRFLVLTATAGQSVTPSQAVDAAWHLHLTYTRDYWLRLTPLLPAALHHDPSGGSSEDTAHFARQYLATLTLYRARFGDCDPLIWPDPEQAAATGGQGIQHSSLRWLAVLALWVVGGTLLFKFGFWAVFGLAVLGFFLVARHARWSSRRRRGGAGLSPEDGGTMGFAGFFGDFGSSDSNGCDGSSSDGGSGCGSGCGGCGS